MRRTRPTPDHFTAEELARLRRLVYQAFDLRDTGYLSDAAAAIEDFHERTLPDRLERRTLERRRAA